MRTCIRSYHAWKCCFLFTLAVLVATMMTGTAWGRGPETARAGKSADAAAAGTTYYIDSVAGKNTNSGTSPDSSWQDFTNINGRTLNAGERLLIKRGSVINQELQISAKGTADHWVEIGDYGEGPRPIIRRNWFIGDRCALITDPDYLRIHSLMVGYAGKGLVVHYATPGHQGLIIEDCIGHHIEGFYFGLVNAAGIPEWRDYPVPTDDELTNSAGIAVTGGGDGPRARNITLRDCDFFQNSFGFFVSGVEGATVDRVYTHHEYAFNTSPHPVLFSLKDSLLENSVFNASGWICPYGTMGLELQGPHEGLTVRNCTFRNQPDAGQYDEGAIDFEEGGSNYVVDNCTFENEAGAAIEVLGLRRPQAKNIEIKNSRFLQDNYAKLLGPDAKHEGPTPRGEIFIWAGEKLDPKISCSNGTIHDNAYVLHPGVEFFMNKAPTTTSWVLQNNTQYATVEELQKAVPYNKPPVVDAGRDVLTNRKTVRLSGSVQDDGKPAGGKLKVKWEMLEGPGNVKFKDDSDPTTAATFPQEGDYWLRLMGDDGELWTSDTVVVRVLKPGVTAIKNWDFNTPLDKEGWTEANLGTQVRQERLDPKKNYPPYKSYPVKYVAGGYYIVAIENSQDPYLLSADGLNVNISKHKTIRVRFQNHTPATRMAFHFITNADTAWDDAKSQSFDVAANDNVPRDYTVDMSRVPGWKGSLKQLRFDLGGGSTVTGTCRIDYIRIDNSKPVAR